MKVTSKLNPVKSRSNVSHLQPVLISHNKSVQPLSSTLPINYPDPRNLKKLSTMKRNEAHLSKGNKNPPLSRFEDTSDNQSSDLENEQDRDLTSIIQQAIAETEAKGFSVARQVAFIEFLTSVNDLTLSLLSDSMVEGMLHLVATIVRMHCSNHEVLPPQHGDAKVQNRHLGVRATELLLKCLAQDARALPLLELDRPMVQGFNLGRLIESVDVDEKTLGLAMALFLLTKHADVIISDICADDKVTARDRIHKHQALALIELLRESNQSGRIADNFDEKILGVHG